MPWKECQVEDERLRFVARLMEGQAMSTLCAEFGISRKTGYKIYERYRHWGLRGLTKCAALELGPYDIRVNLVVPGVIETPASRAAGFPSVLANQPIPQVAQPLVIANASFYLA